MVSAQAASKRSCAVGPILISSAGAGMRWIAKVMSSIMIPTAPSRILSGVTLNTLGTSRLQPRDLKLEHLEDVAFVGVRYVVASPIVVLKREHEQHETILSFPA